MSAWSSAIPVEKPLSTVNSKAPLPLVEILANLSESEEEISLM